MAQKDESSSLAGVIKPLPIEQMVAAPILAAVNAQSLMNDETLEFIENVALDKDDMVRTIPFGFESIDVDVNGEATGHQKKVSIDLPFIALTQVPSMAIESVEVDFELRIHMSTQQKEVKQKEDNMGRKFTTEKDKINIDASLSSKSENTRKTDSSAKYSFKVVAKKQEQPEALAKVIDLLTEASLVPKEKEKK